MSISVPHYISKELFEMVLQNSFDDKRVVIVDYNIQAAVPAGDNYTSDLYRTTITFKGLHAELETLSVIVKTFPCNKEIMQQWVAEIHLFEKEAEMYTKTLPALHKILERGWTLSAKCLYYTEIPKKTIIFEDLKTSGFQMVDRQKGLNLEHCLMIVKKMAYLHASSIVLFEKDPTSFQMFKRGLYDNNQTIVNWVNAACKAMTRACSLWSGFADYSIKFKKLEETCVSRCLESCQRKLGGFNVLNHGDCWVNNFMFSYTQSGKLMDFKFVDYQMVVYTSPVIDLLYFWATSPTLDVQKYYLDTLLDYYHSQLISTLTELSYSLERIPTRKQLRQEWEFRSFYGLIAAMTVLPLVKASARKDASLEAVIEGTDEETGFRHHVYNNDNFKKHMKYLLSYFDKIGVFDF